jgi:plasmid stabilization system protein ParE
MQISLSDEAQADAWEAVDWYAGEGALAAADAFADAVDHALHLLLEFPGLGAPGPHDTRALPLHGFPYSLIYRVQTHTVRVIAIANQSRRPGYWSGRH